MRGAKLTIEIPLEAMCRSAMPANVEVLARAYVGDQCFGLARDPKNRALFLLSLTGYWRLDPQQLVTVFADALREWDRELAIATGATLTGRQSLEPAAVLLPARSVWSDLRRTAAVDTKRVGKKKAG